MTGAARTLLDEVLSLSEDDRLAVATQIVASLATEPAWEDAWLAELVRRDATHIARDEVSADWADVRARVERKLTLR